MVIDDKGDEDEQMEEDVAGTAYRESLTSVDGFTRGPNGRVKFNKDTKKRRRENEDDDVEMADAEATSGKKAKRKADPKFGHEFKAKVRLFRYESVTMLICLSAYRKPEVTLKREASIRTRISHFPKLPRRRAERTNLVLLENDRVCCICIFTCAARYIDYSPHSSLVKVIMFHKLLVRTQDTFKRNSYRA